MEAITFALQSILVTLLLNDNDEAVELVNSFMSLSITDQAATYSAFALQFVIKGGDLRQLSDVVELLSSVELRVVSEPVVRAAKKVIVAKPVKKVVAKPVKRLVFDSTVAATAFPLTEEEYFTARKSDTETVESKLEEILPNLDQLPIGPVQVRIFAEEYSYYGIAVAPGKGFWYIGLDQGLASAVDPATKAKGELASVVNSYGSRVGAEVTLGDCWLGNNNSLFITITNTTGNLCEWTPCLDLPCSIAGEEFKTVSEWLLAEAAASQKHVDLSYVQEADLLATCATLIAAKRK